MADELIDIYAEDGTHLGTALKSEAHRDGLWHRAAHVWIRNGRGEILLQLRSPRKPTWPDRWDISAAGHCAAGEAPIDAALRELAEELGVTARRDELKPLGVRTESRDWQDIKNREFQHVFLLRVDKEAFSFTDGEVTQVRFVAPERLAAELREPARRETYVDHGDYYLEIIAAVKAEITARTPR